MMSIAESVPFEFGGRTCLDFTWTLRYRAVHPTELLTSPGRLAEWLTAADLPSGRVSREQLADALALREAIYAAALDVAGGTPLQSAHVQQINRWATVEPAYPQLRGDGTQALAVRRGHETNAGLCVIACDAVELLSRREASALRGAQLFVAFPRHVTARYAPLVFSRTLRQQNQHQEVPISSRILRTVWVLGR
jgi:hypothetical protein